MINQKHVFRYCELNEQYMVSKALAPTKHNVLCAARSAAEVLDNHDDLQGRLPKPDPNFLPPNVNLRAVREPKVKYVLLMESSSSMIKQNLWKWVSKAAQKFIRHDLKDHTK